MKRKEFIKDGCNLCLGAIAGMSLLTMLDSCASGKIVKAEVMNDELKVLKSSFSPEQSYVLVRANSLNYDLLLNKRSEAEYTALFMQCTHYDNPVFANKTEIFCPTHGSKFDFTGKALKEPATQNLKSYKTTINNDHIIIHLK